MEVRNKDMNCNETQPTNRSLKTFDMYADKPDPRFERQRHESKSTEIILKSYLMKGKARWNWNLIRFRMVESAQPIIYDNN